jgi:hypothetical protein
MVAMLLQSSTDVLADGAVVFDDEDLQKVSSLVRYGL